MSLEAVLGLAAALLYHFETPAASLQEQAQFLGRLSMMRLMVPWPMMA